MGSANHDTFCRDPQALLSEPPKLARNRRVRSEQVATHERTAFALKFQYERPGEQRVTHTGRGLSPGPVAVHHHSDQRGDISDCRAGA
jgi:hypothetical protein